MTDLPWLIRLAPRIFYATAILWVVWSIALPHIQLADLGWSQQLGGAEEAGNYVVLEIAGRAVVDAVFLVGVGVNAQILLYILERMRRGAGKTGSEA